MEDMDHYTGFQWILWVHFVDYHLRGIFHQMLSNSSAWKSCIYRCGVKNMVHDHMNPDIVQQFPVKMEIFEKRSVNLGMLLTLSEPMHAQNWLEIYLYRNLSGKAPDISLDIEQDIPGQKRVGLYTL